MPLPRDRTEFRRYMKTEEERAAIRRHRAEASWREWFFTEFLRYVYALGVLAAVVFVPLQMMDSWLRPPVDPSTPAVVSVAIVAFLAVVLYLGVRGYASLWRKDGWIDRRLLRDADAEDRESH